MLFGCILFLLTIWNVGNCANAIFSVANSGIDGWVTVNDGIVSIWLNFTDVNYDLLPGGASCFEDGLKYHIHTEWSHDDTADQIGAINCGSNYTGGHYDPYLACGPSSGGLYCQSLDSSQCVTMSSVIENNTDYLCNPSDYASQPYVCEVGDWSGKYGILLIGDDNTTNATVSSFWEVNSDDVQGLSVVFHCANTDERAFCAPFDNTNDTSEILLSQTTAADEQRLYAIGLVNDFPIGLFEVAANGTVKAQLFPQYFASKCDSLIYRIYDSWLSSKAYCFGNDCSDIVGAVWDPTVTCLHGSDSQFCNDGRLCNSSSYEYSCDYANDRFSCAPGDFSGKYLTIPFFDMVARVYGIDELLPPLNSIKGKPIVLECGDYSQIVAAAVFMDFQTTEFGVSYDSSWWDANYSDFNENSATIKSLSLIFSIIGLLYWLM